MKLHHLPGSRSCRIRWLLEELGVAYEIETHRLGGPTLRSPTYRALNPLGLVPTLEDESAVLFESGAIVQYLLERHGSGRLEPAPDAAERAVYLQWFHWGEATLIPPLTDIMRHRFVLPEAERSPVALADARKRFLRRLEVVADTVRGRASILRSGFSAADIMLGYGLSLARSVGELPPEPGAVQAYLDELARRPAFQAAFEGGFQG